MPINIFLTQQSGVPVYLQIINQVKQLITSGRLVAEQELPPIRVLAEELLINPNTVARAYRELEAAGWIYKRRGAGTFVSAQASPLSEAVCREQISERIKALLVEAGHMNIGLEPLIQWVRDEYKKLSKES